MNDDELREQLERRTTSAPLAPTERAEIVGGIHRQSSRRQGGWSWPVRLGIPLAAAVTVIVFVIVFGFPRAPQTASTSPTPGDTPSASSEITPSPSAPVSPSPAPASGLPVLSADELAAVVADPSKVGDLVTSDAVINFVPSPTQFDVPDASPQAMGTIDTQTGSIVVMGLSFPDTDWPVHAFQVLDGGRLLYLGPVNDRTESGIWTVPDAISAAPPKAASLMFAVQGWLLLTAAAPCAAPPDFSSSQDYWCGGSWLLPAPPDPATEGMVMLVFPDGIHVQRSAYQDYAENPQASVGLGGDPRLGTYLVRPAGCPPNVGSPCPVWEMVGRLGATLIQPQPSGEPTPGVTDSPTTPPTPAPTPATTSAVQPSFPPEWPTSLTDALSATAIVFESLQANQNAELRAGLWPFSTTYPISSPGSSLVGAIGKDVILLREAPQDIEVVRIDAETGQSDVIGHFPSSDEWFGTTQLGSLEAFVHGSSGDVNDLNATFVDHGVIAWDVLTGAARVVLPPDPNVRTRWDLHVAPGGTTVASGRSPGDSLAYDVLGSNGATHTFETDINLDAISSRYGLGYGQVFDPDLNRVLERHVLVDLSDGSQRLIPAKADALLEICEGCLQYAVGPSWVVDDHHFLLVRSKLWMLDGADNTVTAVFDLAGHGLHPFEIVSPLLSQDWFLVTASAYSEPVDLQALNLNDGTLIELGVAR